MRYGVWTQVITSVEKRKEADKILARCDLNGDGVIDKALCPPRTHMPPCAPAHEWGDRQG